MGRRCESQNKRTTIDKVDKDEDKADNSLETEVVIRTNIVEESTIELVLDDTVVEESITSERKIEEGSNMISIMRDHREEMDHDTVRNNLTDDLIDVECEMNRRREEDVSMMVTEKETVNYDEIAEKDNYDLETMEMSTMNKDEETCGSDLDENEKDREMTKWMEKTRDQLVKIIRTLKLEITNSDEVCKYIINHILLVTHWQELIPTEDSLEYSGWGHYR